MEEVLKGYDKLLTHKENLDGSVDIIRISPFNSRIEHKLLTLENQYVGSADWILRKLISMDTTRYDIIGNAKRNNWNIRTKKDPINMHEDIAEFMVNGGSMFIN